MAPIPQRLVAPRRSRGESRGRIRVGIGFAYVKGVTPRPWSSPVRKRPGRPYPLGATWDGAGVNFALFSENATGVELCMFERPNQGRETTRVRMTEQTAQVWHVYL